ncbi:MAG TPA: hydroxyisourate hydrolase [Bryobacteraceae bacterium]|nr:hydroxyisourate hydrolase [Bryobacteraceae bacterium]
MIITSVYDVSRGVPAARVPVELDLFITGQGWREVGHGVTNSEGVVQHFGEPAVAGLYRLMFDVAAYIPDACFPSVAVVADIRDPSLEHRFPVALSRFGYSVHRELLQGARTQE